MSSLFDLTAMILKDNERPGKIYSIHNSHHIKQPKGMQYESFAKDRATENDLVLYTKQVPVYSQMNHKQNEMINARAHQVSSLKEKLKLKYKNEEETPFPSLYKIHEDFEDIKHSTSKHKSFSGTSGKPHKIPPQFDVKSYCKNNKRLSEKADKTNENVVLKNPNQSFEIPRNKDARGKDFIESQIRLLYERHDERSRPWRQPKSKSRFKKAEER